MPAERLVDFEEQVRQEREAILTEKISAGENCQPAGELDVALVETPEREPVGGQIDSAASLKSPALSSRNLDGQRQTLLRSFDNR